MPRSLARQHLCSPLMRLENDLAELPWIASLGPAIHGSRAGYADEQTAPGRQRDSTLHSKLIRTT
jgi:hypothetical protein